jgi:hypothetical protein
MLEYPFNDRGFLYAGNDLELPAAAPADLDVVSRSGRSASRAVSCLCFESSTSSSSTRAGTKPRQIVDLNLEGERVER